MRSNSPQNKLYVSRAGLKLASVADKFGLDFTDKRVLDVGSSTGGFTDFALQHGAKEVYAVDSGTNQLHTRLRSSKRIRLYERLDIRDFVKLPLLPEFDIVVIDVSFISLKAILPSVSRVCGKNTLIVAMVKPQFEATNEQKYKGIVKNDTIRRNILKDFELWAKPYFFIADKADSEVSGLKGNNERFYVLKRIR